MVTQNKKIRLALNILAGLLTLAFLAAGSSKLAGAEEMVANFARWGFPSWFLYVTGAVEVVGAILLAIPRTRFFGAAALVATMIGAVGTHAMSAEYGSIAPSIVLLALTTTQVWFNRDAINLGSARNGLASRA